MFCTNVFCISIYHSNGGCWLATSSATFLVHIINKSLSLAILAQVTMNSVSTVEAGLDVDVVLTRAGATS